VPIGQKAKPAAADVSREAAETVTIIERPLRAGRGARRNFKLLSGVAIGQKEESV
jgi:hypothetical protein